MMRREYKSKKMLFFIVLLFIIVQIVTITGMAEDTDKELVKERIEYKTDNTIKESSTPIEDILKITSREQEISAFDVVKIEEEKVLKITAVQLNPFDQNIGTVDVGSDEQKTTETPSDDTGVSAITSGSSNSGSSPSPPSTTSSGGNSGSSSSSSSSTTNNIDTSTKSDDKVELPESKTEIPITLREIECNFEFTVAKSKLVTEFCNDAVPGGKLEIKITSEKGIPVENVKVRFIGKSYLTDENGAAVIEIPNLEVGTKLPASVEKGEFEPSYQWIEVVKPKCVAPYIEPLSDTLSTLPSLQNTITFLNRLTS